MAKELAGMYSEFDMICETSMQVLNGSKLRELGTLRKYNI